MQVFLAMAATRPQVLVDHLQRIKEAAQSHPNTLGLAAQVISSVGKLSKVSKSDPFSWKSTLFEMKLTLYVKQTYLSCIL